MEVRVVQIWGFLLTVLGWIFIACSMAMEGWKVTSVGGMGGSSVIRVGWFWSSLWRSCYTASNSVSKCHDFPMLWSVENHVQLVRALLMAGLATGMLGFILSLVGMECTYIGGKETEKKIAIFFGSLCHSTSAVLSAAGYAVYATYITLEFFNPGIDVKYDLGTPMFLGWAGCLFQFIGALLYLVSICKRWFLNKRTIEDKIPAQEVISLQSIPTNISTSSGLTTKSRASIMSELSLKSSSTLSSVSHKPHLFSKA